MKGSSVSNIKFNPLKQKIVQCAACHREMVIGKFGKNGQKCQDCLNSKLLQKIDTDVKIEKQPETFGAKLTKIASELGFTVTDKRLWRKKYAVDSAGVATIHVMVEPATTTEGSRLDYFSYTVQRAISPNEDFRKFMPSDIASDCEIIANECATEKVIKASIGMEICDKCGIKTDEFGTDIKAGQLLCIPCFKKKMSGNNAEAEV